MRSTTTQSIAKRSAIVFAAIAAFAMAVAPLQAQTATNPMGDTFSLQWKEDFTKERELNTKRWSAWYGTGQPTFDSTFGMKLPMPSFLSTGIGSFPNDVFGNFGNTDASKAYHGTVLFGRYAARMYMEPVKGDNQSIWLVRPLFTHDDWNEIDLEAFNADYIKPGTIIPTYSLHYGDWQPVITEPKARDTSVVHPAGWHEWTIDWTPNYVAWYCDGERRATLYNSSWRPGWNERDGTGVEAQLFPQALMFANQGAPDSKGVMTVAWASYSALQMQSFAAVDFNDRSGGKPGVDTKTILNTPGTGNRYVGSLHPGDYLRYNDVQTKWRNISVQVDAWDAGRKIEVRTGSRDGPIIGTINVPVTRGPEWIYTDLSIQDDPAKVASKTRKFATCNSSQEIGKTLTITGGAGFTPGTYTITAIKVVKDQSINAVATLDRAVGKAKSAGGQAILHYQDPIRYTLAGADLKPRNGPPQDIYLTFTGGEGGFSLYNIYFFGTEPTSRK